ncbi:MAG: dihydroxyacetone kinase subunit DhaK, partial [Rikenellaceae bacterium]
RGDKMLLYINGVGSSTLMEQFIVYRAAAKVLEDAGVEVVHGHAGELLTVQESGGFQMILARLDSDHVDYLKNYKANAPYWKCFGK